MPSQFHVIGCSHSAHGYILCCFVLDPGFSSMSPDSMSISNSVEWFLLALIGNVIGLRPADVHLFSRLVSR